MIKTRLQTLEVHHDSAMLQIIEKEINIALLKKRMLLLGAGKLYTQAYNSIKENKDKIVVIKDILKIVEELIEKEKNAKNL
jgi:hypothetical protein